MIKYRKIDILLVTDIDKSPETISKRYRYMDIGDISTIFSIYRPTSRLYHYHLRTAGTL